MGPARVPDAYPPRPLVTSHSGVNSSRSSSSAAFQSRRRTTAGICFTVPNRAHDDPRFGRKTPAVFSLDQWSSEAAVARVLTGPLHSPPRAGGTGEQRLGGGIDRQLAPEIDEKQSITGVAAEVPDHERLECQNRAVEAARPLGGEEGIVEPDTEALLLKSIP